MEKTLQEREYEYFRSHLGELLADPRLNGKFVVVSGCAIKGFHDTFQAAYEAALSEFQPGSFIVQQVVGENDTVSFLAAAV